MITCTFLIINKLINQINISFFSIFQNIIEQSNYSETFLGTIFYTICLLSSDQPLRIFER